MYLLDNFGRLHTFLRISIVSKCNLKCKYCVPNGFEDRTSLKSSLMNKNDVLTVADYFISRGVRKIKITGGEPSLHPDLVEIVHGLNSLKKRYSYFDDIGITTNGVILQNKLRDLKTAGLNSINLSIDDLNPQKYAKITKMNALNMVLSALFNCVALKFNNVKVNSVLLDESHNYSKCIELIKLAYHYPIEVRFIEYMPFGANSLPKSEYSSSSFILDRMKQEFNQISPTLVDYNSTSKMYKIPNSLGKFGFISSMSDSFCGTCNRLRITADGKFKGCLHDEREVNLLPILRNKVMSEEEKFAQLDQLIAEELSNKKFGHDSMSDLYENNNRMMRNIGG